MKGATNVREAISPYMLYCARKENSIQKNMNRPELTDKLRQQIKEFRSDYLFERKNKDEKHLTIPTHDGYIRNLSDFGVFLAKKGITSFKNVKKQTIKEYLDTTREWSISRQIWNKTSLKVFYRQLLTGKIDKRDKFPAVVNWIVIGSQPPTQIEREDLPTPDECKAMLDACRNLRDRAFVSLLMDGGMRLTEALEIRISDIFFEEKHPYIKVRHSKTKKRPVYLIDSISDVRNYLEQHPKRGSKDFDNQFLFVPLSFERSTRQFCEQSSMYITLQRIAKRAGVKKKIWNHLFRHVSITDGRNDGLSDQHLAIKYGLSSKTHMLLRYAHVVPEDVAKAQLKARGMEDETLDIDPKTAKICPHCKKKAPWTAVYCRDCSTPLDSKKYKQAIQRQIEKDSQQTVILKRLDTLDALLNARKPRFRKRIKRKDK